MTPMGLTQAALAQAMGVPRKHVNELCNDRRSVTAPRRCSSSPASSGPALISGSIASAAAICGRRCARLASASGPSGRGP